MLPQEHTRMSLFDYLLEDDLDPIDIELLFGGLDQEQDVMTNQPIAQTEEPAPLILVNNVRLSGTTSLFESCEL